MHVPLLPRSPRREPRGGLPQPPGTAPHRARAAQDIEGRRSRRRRKARGAQGRQGRAEDPRGSRGSGAGKAEEQVRAPSGTRGGGRADDDRGERIVRGRRRRRRRGGGGSRSRAAESGPGFRAPGRRRGRIRRRPARGGGKLARPRAAAGPPRGGIVESHPAPDTGRAVRGRTTPDARVVDGERPGRLVRADLPDACGKERVHLPPGPGELRDGEQGKGGEALLQPDVPPLQVQRDYDTDGVRDHDDAERARQLDIHLGRVDPRADPAPPARGGNRSGRQRHTGQA